MFHQSNTFIVKRQLLEMLQYNRDMAVEEWPVNSEADVNEMKTTNNNTILHAASFPVNLNPLIIECKCIEWLLLKKMIDYRKL